eukprot:403373762
MNSLRLFGKLKILSTSYSIIMEFADDGDLYGKCAELRKNQSYMNEQDIWHLFIQLVKGIQCLHQLNIMHRDLKSANVFLYKDKTAKIGDMNVSKLARKDGFNYTQTGTPFYASPEVWKDEPYNFKSDIWSLGCVLYEMIALKPPFNAPDMNTLYKRVLKGLYPKIPSIYSGELSDMIKMLLNTSPQLRPSADKILKMPIIQRKLEKMFPEETNPDSSVLLQTLRNMKDIMKLKQSVLYQLEYQKKSSETFKKSKRVGFTEQHKISQSFTFIIVEQIRHQPFTCLKHYKQWYYEQKFILIT